MFDSLVNTTEMFIVCLVLFYSTSSFESMRSSQLTSSSEVADSYSIFAQFPIHRQMSVNSINKILHWQSSLQIDLRQLHVISSIIESGADGYAIQTISNFQSISLQPCH